MEITGLSFKSRQLFVFLQARKHWSFQEDCVLFLAVHIYAGSKSKDLPTMMDSALSLFNSSNIPWVKVASHVPGRSDQQCRERWCNHINPALRRSRWTKQVGWFSSVLYTNITKCLALVVLMLDESKISLKISQ